MAYYMGDYYQGDYYQGDPFLGLGTIFGAAKWIGKKIFKRKPAMSTAVMPRGFAPMATAAPFLGRIGTSAIGSVIGRGIMRDRSLRAMQKVPGVRGTLQRILPGGATGYENGCPPGKYVQVKDGEPTGKCLSRRMNVTNSKALRRSLRRVAGFGKLASRARRDIGRAATAVGVSRGRRGPVARHHARIRAKAA